MFVKNRSELTDLGRTQEEKKIIIELIELTNFILTEAQPSNLMSSAICASEEKLVVSNKEFKLNQFHNLFLIAFGKASQKMARWFLEIVPKYFSRIIIVSPDIMDEFFRTYTNVSFYQGGHPKPTKQSVQAAEEVISLLLETTKADFCIFLVSGGGSALLEQPDYDVSFDDYVSLVDLLLSSNASIQEINTIRKHFSKVKGGKLAQLTQAKIISIILSDVLGNDISSIASGPTAPDTTTWNDCEKIFSNHSLLARIPESVLGILSKGLKSEIIDTPSKKELFEHVENYIVGDNLKLQSLLQDYLCSNGNSEILNDTMIGESREVGQNFANQINLLVRDLENNSDDTIRSTFYRIFGGETTVTLNFTNGKGGRNQELALSFALSLEKDISVYLLSLGTDGIDGNSNAAGAIIGPFTLDESNKIETAKKALAENNSNSFFKKHGGEIITGYTGTNLMDIGVIIFNKKLAS